MAKFIENYQSVGYSFVTHDTLCHVLASENKLMFTITPPIPNLVIESNVDDNNETQQSSITADDTCPSFLKSFG